MLPIAEIVREIVFSSEIARTALTEGYLNLSAYAKSIRAQVEARTHKPASIASIVVALSRTADTLKPGQSLIPAVIIQDIAIRSGLVELAFAKTPETKEKLKVLYQDTRLSSAEFCTITHGIGELSIVVSQELSDLVLRIFKGYKPKLLLSNLGSITIRFDDKYIETPNTTFAFLRPLALRRINVVEIFSTFTELTFMLSERDLENAFVTINRAFGSSKMLLTQSTKSVVSTHIHRSK